MRDGIVAEEVFPVIVVAHLSSFDGWFITGLVIL